MKISSILSGKKILIPVSSDKNYFDLIFIIYFPFDVLYGKIPFESVVNNSENSEYTPLVADQLTRLYCPFVDFL